jgi:transcriptional regulator with XRE-family HTH domain
MKTKAKLVEEYIGLRIRTRRRELGLTQGELGKSLDVTAPQVVKYENGKDGVGAGRLPQLAAVLQVPLDYFFPKAEWETSPFHELPQHVALALEVISSYVENQNDQQGLRVADFLAKLPRQNVGEVAEPAKEATSPAKESMARPGVSEGRAELLEVEMRFSDETIRVFRPPDFWLSFPGGLPTLEFLGAGW